MMAPDLNTLTSPQSPSTMSSSTAMARRPRHISISTTSDPRDHSPLSDSPTLSSLHAAATMNASLYSSSPSRDPISVERRRSSVQYNIHHNDPNVPAPGEMQHSDGSNNSIADNLPLRRTSLGAPHRHSRQPSLGEIYSTLEHEQEAQVNRLLYQIRVQQEHLNALTSQRSHQDHHSQPPTPSSGGPSSASPVATHERSSPRPIPEISSLSQSNPFNRPRTLSRQSSHQMPNVSDSHGASPALRPVSGGGFGPLSQDFFLGGRDESVFYKTETQNLTRENQLLKARIRDLEREMVDMECTKL